jgi:hypothetical protein
VTAFDWLAIALIGLSALYGVTRGLVFEVISLLGWGAAFWCAQAFATGVAAWLPIGEAEAAWRYPLAFVLVFVGVAFGVGLAASLMRRLVSAAGLSPVDRTLGGRAAGAGGHGSFAGIERGRLVARFAQCRGSGCGIAGAQALAAGEVGKLPALRGSFHVWNRRRRQSSARQSTAL